MKEGKIETNNEPKIVTRAREAAKRLFNLSPEERTTQAMSIMKNALNDDWIKKELTDIDVDVVEDEIKKIQNSQDSREYSQRLLEIFDPLIQLAISHPEEFAQMQRRNFGDAFEPVNDLLRYGIDGDDLHIHVADASDMNQAQILSLITQGLRDLARIVVANKQVKVITATSPLVAEHPNALQYFGFTIDGPIDEETKRRDFPAETRFVSRASISREDFLRLYSPTV